MFLIIVGVNLLIGGGLLSLAYHFGVARGAAKAERELAATAASNRLEAALSRIESLKG